MTIRWGIIGCGDVTEVKSGPGFQKARDSRLVAVMRRNAELARDYAARHNVPRWYADADELINDTEVDAVYIGTPPGSHLELALRVCAAGKPCYVEKPMARSYAECEGMIKAFARREVPLFVAYYRRCLPRFVKAKELVENGSIGRPVSFHYRYAAPPKPDLSSNTLPWRYVAEHSGGGLFLDLGSHLLDVIDFILGPLEDVRGAATNLASPYSVEDTVALSCRTASGALGAASWSFAAGVSQDALELIGTDGRITLSCFGTEPVRLETSAGITEYDGANPPHVQQELIQTIVDQLHGRGACPSTGETAARTSRVMDAVLESYYGSRADEFWKNTEAWQARN